MILRQLTSAALLLIGSAVSAAPTVSGDTITWPDDGWYQVQDELTYTEVCGGTRSCKVEPGLYVVINHSTGERFENIAVNVEATTPDIAVTQNVISWPDNGWYQVQDAENDETICNGGLRCVVKPGIYRVINHSTGIRYEGFIVGGTSAPTSVADLRFERYSSTAIELFWSHPDSGEPANGYSILQDGVPIARVSGRSLYIDNLPDTRGYEFVVAQSGQASGTAISVTAAGNFLNLSNAEAIFANVVSVINEDAIEEIYKAANDDNLFQGKFFFISNTSDDIQFVREGILEAPYALNLSANDLVDATRFVEYSCAGGGSLRGFIATSVQATDWIFNECVIGSNVYIGTYESRQITRGEINSADVKDFTVTDSSGMTRALSGNYLQGNQSFVGLDTTMAWNSANYIEQFSGAGDRGVLTIDDYTVTRRQREFVDVFEGFFDDTADGPLIEFREQTVQNNVSGFFAVSAPWSENSTLLVSVGLSFADIIRTAVNARTREVITYPGTDLEEEFNWQNGFIAIEADDGSSLNIEPIAGQPNTFIISTGSGESLGPVFADVRR